VRIFRIGPGSVMNAIHTSIGALAVAYGESR
jgi:hypothetical protein